MKHSFEYFYVRQTDFINFYIVLGIMKFTTVTRHLKQFNDNLLCLSMFITVCYQISLMQAIQRTSYWPYYMEHYTTHYMGIFFTIVCYQIHRSTTATKCNVFLNHCGLIITTKQEHCKMNGDWLL